MSPGETVKFSCPNCRRDFDICLKPDVSDTEPADVGYCPFCGEPL